MDRTELTVRNTLAAIEAPLYDVGVLRIEECFQVSKGFREKL